MLYIGIIYDTNEKVPGHDRIRPAVTTPPDGRVVEDLTARARIRDAAIRLFTERGVGGATIRDIARAARVSGGLIRHHFGSKDELRTACDRYALDRLVSVKEDLVLRGQMADPGFLAAAHPGLLLVYRYLARSMIDGSPEAAAMFEELVEATDAWIATNNPGLVEDRHGYAALMVAMELGALVMHDQLTRVLGVDVLSPEGHLRLAKAKLEFYSTPVLSHAFATDARSTIESVERATEERRMARTHGPQRR